MRKLLLSVIMLLVIIHSAYADVQKFGNIIVDVPSGWEGSLQGSTLVVKSKTKSASLAIAFNSMGNANLTDIAERLYIQMGGENLEQDEDGDYSFTFKNLAGTDSIALVGGADGYYIVVSITGFQDESVHEDMERIIDSLDYED